MITAETLINSGYRKYPATWRPYASAVYQKRVDDEHGKKYFVNVYEYAGTMSSPKYSYEGDAQFVDGYGNTFNVQLLHPESVEQVDEFFERIFVSLKCEHYEEWE